MTSRAARGLWAPVVLLALLLLSPALRAEPQHRVLVVDARDMNDATTLELLARVRGELGAAGFEVVVLPVDGVVEPRAAVETLGRDLAPAAVLSVRHTRGRNPGESVAEMWVSDRLSNRTLTQRAVFDDRETSAQTARLAVQVAELLKARLALLWVDPAPSTWTPVPARPEPPAVEAPQPPLPPVDEAKSAAVQNQLSLGAGVGLLHNFKGGFGSAWAPLLRVGFRPSALSSSLFALELRVSAAGSPDSSKLAWGPGSARIRQGLLLAEAFGRFMPSAPLQPIVSLGNGAYVVSAVGEADPPFSSSASTTWSGLTALGAGLCFQPSPRVAWMVEGQMLASWSKTSIAITDRTIASVGAAMAFVSTSVVGIY
jgi:hypothetical protein